MSKQKVHVVLAVLKLAPTVHDLSAQTRSILAAVIASKWLPSPTPTAATLKADVDALDAAETVALTKVKGAVAVRDAKKRIVIDDLHTLKAYVQSIANANPADAVAIIQSAGMTVKKTSTRSKQDLTVKNATVSGSVHVIAKAASPARAAYDWQWSTDLKTWTAVPSTLQAHTTVTGLTQGTMVYFRHRSLTKTGWTDWSVPSNIVVQ